MTDLSNEANAEAAASGGFIEEPNNDSVTETEEEDDWSTTWVCTQPNYGWSQHDGDRFDITASGAVIFYLDGEVTGVANNYEDIFRKDLLPLEWLYQLKVEPRPKPEPIEKAFEVEIKLPEINKSSLHPTDAEGFYSVTDCLPESVIIIDEHEPYVTLKYTDGRTETGIYYVAIKEFKRSRFSWAPNLAFAKTSFEVVGWKYR